MKLFKEGNAKDYYESKAKTIKHGRCSKEEFKNKFGTASSSKNSGPCSYLMVNGIPHKYNKNGILIPLKKLS